ncbi:WAS/WASL-interacting protein family member 1-like [Eubalaena glacialis]|uniref:WAS/WASL-interacting protein family member 1-like n=1 Tax=Eubalaena glacialis TaxID=27606 RepID=UPI002A5A0385|nr:WAS/WASL-interacting protein family member 1-like [Eubalaena glacialis]
MAFGHWTSAALPAWPRGARWSCCCSRPPLSPPPLPLPAQTPKPRTACRASSKVPKLEETERCWQPQGTSLTSAVLPRYEVAATAVQPPEPGRQACGSVRSVPGYRRGDLEPPPPQITPPQDPLLVPSQAQQQGLGGGQGTDVYPHQTPPPAPFSNKFLSYSQLWSFLFGPVSNV